MKWGQFIIAAVATAWLLSIAFPSWGLGILVWVALVPVLRAAPEKGTHRFLFGWLTGTLIQAFGYGWIFFTIRDFGGLSTGLSAAGAALFWMFQGLDMALWLGFGPWLFRGRHFLLRAFGMAGFWLLIQSFLFPYVFPANYGAALAGLPVLGMGAALWSGKGMTFWIVAFQTVLALPESSKPKRWPLAIGILLIPLFGMLVPRGVETDTVRIGVVQPNIIPWAKRGGLSPRDIVAAHENPTRRWSGGQVDLVLWPETAVPFDLRHEDAYLRRLQELAASLNAPLVTGAVGIYGPNRYGNEIWLIPPDGTQPLIYQKEKLVLFSETLPWLLSWATFFDEALGGFQMGQQNQAFPWRERKLVPLVCFEALFPSYVRKRQGHLMLNLTNDAWFGKTKASALHLQHIRHRAVEMGVPLIRATNSGISCFIDAKGKIHGATALYEPDAVIYQVPVPKNQPVNPSAIGELLVVLSAVGMVGFALWKCLLRRRKKMRTSH